MMKKLMALVLAMVMVLAVAATAFAVELKENNEEGVAGNWNEKDKERLQGNTVVLKKEIVAYNPNGTPVYAPVVTYTYTVTPATVSNLDVTDEATDHTSGVAATAPVQEGKTAGLKVNNGTAGTTANATGELKFTNANTWNTATAGQKNTYDITLDFSGVTFTQPGVYRYQIAETISPDYDKVAMKDGEFDTVYLDVYVDGENKIYGYVCMKTNASVTPTTKKINGFVNGSDGDGSDKYYTYDLVLSKDVVNDTYAATNTAFPFTVFFNNSESYTSTFVIAQTAGTGSTGLNNSAETLTLAADTVALSGVALVKDGNVTEGTTVGDITLKGIPAGVDVDVYETNIVTGVTYTVATAGTVSEAQTDNNVSWGSTPASAVAQSTKAAYESTKATVNTTKVTATAEQSVAITNTLLLISPTGVVLRIAPYMLILVAGVALLVICFHRRKASAKED